MIAIQDIYPSIICANYLHLKDQLQELETIGFEYIHADVMDGNFVPQITIGSEFIQWLKIGSRLKIDTHLMVHEPEKHIKSFVNKSDIITFHYEATQNVIKCIETIKGHNIKCSIAINPKTDILLLKDYIDNDLIDMVLIMTVEAGAYGQRFMQDVLQKIQALNQIIKEKDKNIIIQVDGGITGDNINICKIHGASKFVCGSSIFKIPNRSIAQATQSLIS